MKKITVLVLIVFICNLCSFGTVFANDHCIESISCANHHGIKGNFKIPTITSGWNSTTGYWNKINFEEWIPVKNTSSWFEVGYKKGAINMGNNVAENYDGFFKAKFIDGVFTASKITSKSATVGTEYTITIVDYIDNNNLWEIYIGSTYIGAFSDTVGYVNGSTDDQGFEVVNTDYSSQSIASTYISEQYYFARDTDDYDNDGNTTEVIWKKWSNKTVTATDNTGLVNCSYSSANNKTTFTQQ